MNNQMKKLLRTILYRLNYYKAKRAVLKGINMGGGGDVIPGFINLDADWKTDCHIVTDLTTKMRYADNTIQYLYNSHTLEHLPRRLLPGILTEWHRVLIPEGKLFICIPNLEVLCNIYLENIKDYSTNKETADLARNIIYGGQKDQFDFHYNGYSFVTLKAFLEEIGFKNVRKFDHQEFEYLKDVRDAGTGANINGTSVSLNVVAEK
jgi:predicted SAM-dependent methyltransferase